MKQYKRGIQAYQAVTANKPENNEEQPVITENKRDNVVNTSSVDFKKVNKDINSGLIKTVSNKKRSNSTGNSKYEKVAKLLLILGKEEAGKILSHLSDDEIEKVSLEISKIDRVGKSEASELLEEFGKSSNLGFNRAQGGVETARSILIGAFGADKGNEILYKAIPDSKDKPFSFLNDLDFNQRMLVLKKESASVLTIVLNYLEPSISSPILESLTPEVQREVVKRLYKLKHVSPQVINVISDTLKNKIKLLGTTDQSDIDGRGALADILKHMDRDSEKNIMTKLEESDPFLTDVIRDRLYTIDIIYNINPIDFQKIIQSFSDRDLVYLIKGESVDIQNKIWESMSEGRRVLVKEEMDAVGLIKKSDADKMTRSFIEMLHEKEKNGEINIHDDDDWIY